MQAANDSEVRNVREVIDAHRIDLLPKDYTVERLIGERAEVMESAKKAFDDENESDFLYYQSRLTDLESRISRLLDFALYYRMYSRLQDAGGWLFLMGIGALLSLAMFAYAANPKKEQEPSDPSYVVIDHRPSHYQMAPNLAPVLFATGSADVTPMGLETIAVARNFLRTNPEDVLLLRAHTDTVASDSRNRTLARRRGEAVRRLLLQPGGIAPNRVFVAELPKLDLPHLTNPEMAEQRNRSVEFLAAQVHRASGSNTE